MNLIIERAKVWAASLDDQPGGLVEVLRILKKAGADLDFIIARRTSEEPGKGVVFVTPLRAEEEIIAAAEAGFNLANGIHSVRVQGHNQPGIAADLAAILAEAKLSLRTFSASELGTRFVIYLGLDSEADADRAVGVLQRARHASGVHWQRSAA